MQLDTDSRPVVVTGGAGFIGSHLVERLLSDGHSVTVIDDFSTGNLRNLASVAGDPRLRVISSKVSELEGLNRVIEDASYVFHLAAAVGVELVVRSPIRTIETNLRETEVLLAAACQAKVPVLFASTSEVYGKSQRTEFEETDDLLIGPPTLGRWSYACSKLMDEFLALAYLQERGLSVTIVRLFNTVGPRQTGQFGMVLPRFIDAARSGRALRVYGDGQQTRCFCYVGDTIESLIRLRNCPGGIGEIFNVGSDESVTILELADRVRAFSGSPSGVEFIPYETALAPGFEDMRHRKPSLKKLEHFVQFRPRTSLDSIIGKMLAAG